MAFIVGVLTALLAWRSISLNMEAAGKGWFFRNWLGATIGTFLAIIAAILVSIDGWLWPLVGGILCLYILASWISSESVNRPDGVFAKLVKPLARSKNTEADRTT